MCIRDRTRIQVSLEMQGTWLFDWNLDRSLLKGNEIESVINEERMESTRRV